MKNRQKQQHLREANERDKPRQHAEIAQKLAKIALAEAKMRRTGAGERHAEHEHGVDEQVDGQVEHEHDEQPRDAVDRAQDADAAAEGIRAVQEDRRGKDERGDVDPRNRRERRKQHAARRPFEEDREHVPLRIADLPQVAVAVLEVEIIGRGRLDERKPEDDPDGKQRAEHDERALAFERPPQKIPQKRKAHIVFYELPCVCHSHSIFTPPFAIFFL